MMGPRHGGEVIIGLEVHVQLRTQTKLFCADRAEYGGPANTRVCPVCLGLPGALPVLNAHAVRLAAVAALGLGCMVHSESRFARKAYFYPDLPRGYQISQHDFPLATAGRLTFAASGTGPQTVRIRRVHLEEDTGKSLHHLLPDATALDFNRAGVPLVELVTEPDLRSPSDARAFLLALKRLLEHLGVSDCDMEKGSLRVDANLSRAGPGGETGTPTELKNLNSFAKLEAALVYEAERQRRVLESGGEVRRETRRWDDERSATIPLRGKEEAEEYRFFPEPDLPPLRLDAAWIDGLRGALPELPAERLQRLIRDHALPVEHAEALIATRPRADYYDAVVAAGAEPGLAASWILREVREAVRAAGVAEESALLPATELAALLREEHAGRLTRTMARQLFERMITGNLPFAQARRHAPGEPLGAERIRAAAAAVLERHPEERERYRAGEEKLLGFFAGAVMRELGGRADGREVKSVLRETLLRG